MQTNVVYLGDCLEVMKTFEDNSIDLCVTSPPRDDKGRFQRGYRYSQNTEFKKGESHKTPKPYWNYEWLYEQYVILKKSAKEIALTQNCTEANILFYLRKNGIKARTPKEVRKYKTWGCKGEKNGMYGRTGELNPNWNGGHSPERQTLYARALWRELKNNILKRDNYCCRECGNKGKLNVHHIKGWSHYPELKFEPSNLITLCVKCHKKKHQKR